MSTIHSINELLLVESDLSLNCMRPRGHCLLVVEGHGEEAKPTPHQAHFRQSSAFCETPAARGAYAPKSPGISLALCKTRSMRTVSKSTL